MYLHGLLGVCNNEIFLSVQQSPRTRSNGLKLYNPSVVSMHEKCSLLIVSLTFGTLLFVAKVFLFLNVIVSALCIVSPIDLFVSL